LTKKPEISFQNFLISISTALSISGQANLRVILIGTRYHWVRLPYQSYSQITQIARLTLLLASTKHILGFTIFRSLSPSFGSCPCD